MASLSYLISKVFSFRQATVLRRLHCTMRILIALACLLALTGAASIEKDGINSEVLRESVEANEPSSIVHKTDADVNAVDNDVYQTDDEDAPAARNEAINGRNRYGYGRNLISSNVPQPVPKTDTDFSGSYESNGDDSNDFDSIGVLHVYYPVAYGDGVDTRGGVGRGGYGRGGFGRGGYGRGGFGRGGGYGRGSYSRAFPVYGYGQ